MSATTVDILTCAECRHPWESHLPERSGGECYQRIPAGGRCLCAEAQPVISMADRMAHLRAEKGGTLLVSKVDDKRTILIGHTVTEARDGDDQKVGIVVERGMTEDGEPWVTTVEFIHRGQDLQVVSHRFLVDQLRQEVLPAPDPYACSLAARKLHRVIGQRIRRNGFAERLTDQERRYRAWAEVLDNAANPT